MGALRAGSIVALGVVPAAIVLGLVVVHGQVQTNDAAIAPVRGGPFPRQLTLFDRQGNLVRTLGEPSNYDPPTLSPDGAKLAVIRSNPTQPRIISDADPGRRSVVRELWVMDLSTGARIQVASGPELRDSAWSPDGSWIAYSAYRDGHRGIYQRAWDGTGAERLLYRHDLGVVSLAIAEWSPDGRFLNFEVDGVLWVVPLTTAPSAIELLREEYEAGTLRLSADSRFAAYQSNESGRDEVYVRAFDAVNVRFSPEGGIWQVSNQSTSGPEGSTIRAVQWRADGRELYYHTSDGRVMAVEVTTTPTFTAGVPTLLFRTPTAAAGHISRDGQRAVFAVPRPPERTVVAVAPTVLAAYVGTYAGPEETYAVVTLEGTQLMTQTTGGPKVPLFAESETDFFRRSPNGDVDIVFVKNDEGTVTHLVWYNGGPIYDPSGAGQRWPRQRAGASCVAGVELPLCPWRCS